MSKNTPLQTRKEWYGRFALPGSDEHTLQGRLTFDPLHGISGEAFGHIPNVPVIAFLSGAGGRILLQRCSVQTIDQSEMIVSKIRAVSLLIELTSHDHRNLPLQDPIRFQDADLNYTGLLEWTGCTAISGFSSVDNPVTGTLSTQLETVEFLDAMATIGVSHSTSYSRTQVEFSSHSYVQLSFASPKTAAEALHQSEKLRQMLSVCKGGTVWFEQISLTTPDADGAIRFSLLISQGETDSVSLRQWTLRPRGLEEAKTFIARWSSILAWTEPLAVILMEIWLSRGNVLQFLILALTQALEGAHRCRCGDSLNFVPARAWRKFHERFRQNVRDFVNAQGVTNAEELARSINDRSSHAHEPQLRERLTDFSNEVPIAFWTLISQQPDEWVNKVVKGRNSLTHISGTLDPHADSGGMLTLLWELEVFSSALLTLAISNDIDRAERAMLSLDAAFHLASQRQAAVTPPPAAVVSDETASVQPR